MLDREQCRQRERLRLKPRDVHSINGERRMTFLNRRKGAMSHADVRMISWAWNTPHARLLYLPVGTPGWNGGVGWGRYPPHPPNPGWPEGTSKIVIFAGFWAFGESRRRRQKAPLGEFSHFTLSSRLLPFYIMRFARVMSMSRPVGGYYLYTAAETAVIRQL